MRDETLNERDVTGHGCTVEGSPASESLVAIESKEYLQRWIWYAYTKIKLR